MALAGALAAPAAEPAVVVAAAAAQVALVALEIKARQGVAEAAAAGPTQPRLDPLRPDHKMTSIAPRKGAASRLAMAPELRRRICAAA